MIHKWTLENQQMWKSRLKQLIKDSGQTQVEVARSMAKIVGVLEHTSVSQNAFVAPLSRFVNAKGNEIDRWFELTASRLSPLSKALRLESTDILIRLRKEILFGEGQYPVHSLFPTIEWRLDWFVEGQTASENTLVSSSCTLTKRLLEHQYSDVQVEHHLSYTNVDLPKWEAVRIQMAQHLDPVQQGRLDALPSSLWSSMGLEFGAALHVLHVLLTNASCWKGDTLSPEWVQMVQREWLARRIIKPCVQSFRLSEEQGLIVWSVIQHCLNRTSMEQLVVDLREVVQSSTKTDFDPTWALNLQSTDESVVKKAIDQIGAWVSLFPSEAIVRHLISSDILTEHQNQVVFRSSLRECCMASLVLHSSSIDPYHPVWWSALWWAIQGQEWRSIHTIIADLDAWEASSVIGFVLSEVDPTFLSIDADGVSLGSVDWSTSTIEQAWSLVLLKQYSGFFELMTLFERGTLMSRFHRLSEMLFHCLSPWSGWDAIVDSMCWSHPQVQVQPLVYWAPYQVQINSMNQWETLQSQVAFPLWRVLEAHAINGSIGSAQLLAQGEDLGSDVWIRVPVTVRLSWLSTVPSSRKTLYLFQAMLVDYWQQPQPQIAFVLNIGQSIGFDTVLSWMQGWVNPLFLAQQESGLILGRVAFQFAEHFNRTDLIVTWSRILWNWLRDKDSIQPGFVHWNSRRVPVVDGDIETLMLSVSELLELGLTLQSQPSILNRAILELDAKWITSLPSVQYVVLSRIVLQWKRTQLAIGDSFFLQRWLHQAPLVDLEVERAILDSPALLDQVWRLDTDGLRRSEITRLAGLVRPIPSWAVALANRSLVETGYWPSWLSPHTKEAVGLLPMMIEKSEGVHRLWWLKVYSQHGEVSVDIWRTLHVWLQSSSWRTEQIQTVHFLGPNQTPRMTFGDVLSWILTLHQRVPKQLHSNPAQIVMHRLKNIYTTALSSLSVAEFFALMVILSRNNFQQTLWSLEVLSEHWASMTTDLQNTYRVHWLANNQQCTDFIHPIVGDWVLEYAILHDHSHAYEFLVGRMHEGNLDGLNTLLYAASFESKLMRLFDLFLKSNPKKRTCVQDWILARPVLLQHRNPSWQRWMRQIVMT